MGVYRKRLNKIKRCGKYGARLWRKYPICKKANANALALRDLDFPWQA